MAGVFGLCLWFFGSGATWASDPNKGGQIYATQCASCHGASGVSVMPNAPNFARGEGMLQPDPVIAASIRNGMNAMPAFQGILSDSDIMDVVVYLRTLN
jgi:cytochrome c6